MWSVKSFAQFANFAALPSDFLRLSDFLLMASLSPIYWIRLCWLLGGMNPCGCMPGGGGGVAKLLSNGDGAAGAGALHVAGGADGIVGAGGTAELDAAPAPTNGDVGTAPAPMNGDVGAGLCDPCAFRERACSAAWAHASCGDCGSAAGCCCALWNCSDSC